MPALGQSPAAHRRFDAAMGPVFKDRMRLPVATLVLAAVTAATISLPGFAKAPAAPSPAPLLVAPAPLPPPPIPDSSFAVDRPVWLRKPSLNEFRIAASGLSAGAEARGAGTIVCRVTATGGLSDCKVWHEYPEGAGFGGAAVKLAPTFAMRTTQTDGAPAAGGYVIMPINFDLDGPATVVEARPDGSRVVTKPAWLRLPTPVDLARYYPSRAQNLGKHGRAVVRCTVTFAGLFTDCVVVSEDPAEFGFGQTTLRMVKLFRMRPWTADGQSIEGALATLPVNFTLGGGEAVPAAPPAAPQ